MAPNCLLITKAGGFGSGWDRVFSCNLSVPCRRNKVALQRGICAAPQAGGSPGPAQGTRAVPGGESCSVLRPPKVYKRKKNATGPFSSPNLCFSSFELGNREARACSKPLAERRCPGRRTQGRTQTGPGAGGERGREEAAATRPCERCRPAQAAPRCLSAGET